MDGILPPSHMCLFVVLDGRIVYIRFLEAGERGGVIHRVCRQVLYEADKVMDSVFLVVRNDE